MKNRFFIISILFFLFSTLCFSSCFVDSGSELSEEAENGQIQNNISFEDFLKQENIEKIGDSYFMEGDIALSYNKAHQLYKLYKSNENNTASSKGFVSCYYYLNNPSHFFARKWNDQDKLNLTYFFENNLATSSLTNNQVRQAFIDAAAVWMAVVDIQFSQVSNATNAKITIFGNTSPPAEKQNNPAWAFFPYDDTNRINFNIDCVNNGTYSYNNIRSLFIHELGHVLGLLHEHARGDATNRPYSNPSDYQGENSSTPYGIRVGDYDPDSIMHYGYRDSQGNWHSASYSNRLSDGDIAAIRFLYEAVNLGGGYEAYNGPYDYSAYEFHIGDVNGDGYDDSIGIRKDDERFVVWKSNGSGGSFNGGYEAYNGPFNYSAYEFHVGDVNGDGYDDMIGVRRDDERFVVWKSNGSGGSFNGGYEAYNGPYNYSAYEFHVGDVNGDGFDDIMSVRKDDERFVVWKSKGSSGYIEGGNEYYNGPYDYSSYEFHVGDVNGDNKKDMIGIRRDDERFVVWQVMVQ
ncbi:MAG: matrixin family metalloprotease [bacterium]|nr:matrixin family metalloprotease [bacterium]